MLLTDVERLLDVRWWESSVALDSHVSGRSISTVIVWIGLVPRRSSGVVFEKSEHLGPESRSKSGKAQAKEGASVESWKMK